MDTSDPLARYTVSVYSSFLDDPRNHPVEHNISSERGHRVEYAVEYDEDVHET